MHKRNEQLSIIKLIKINLIGDNNVQNISYKWI